MEHDYQAAEDAFSSGSISYATDVELSKHLLALANKPIENDRIKHRDIIRGITINHMLLQNHIDRLNKQNKRTEKWVIALAVAALISSIVQIFSPLLLREQPTALKPQISATLGHPIPGKTPSFRSRHKENPLNHAHHP